MQEFLLTASNKKPDTHITLNLLMTIQAFLS